MMNDKISKDELELLWKQYSLHVDLYKFYFDVSLKGNIFFYAITGGILAFYFAHSSEHLIKYSLLVPIIMSITFSGICAYGSKLMKIVRKDIFQIRDRLGLATSPDANALIWLLRVFAALFFVVAIGIILLMILHQAQVTNVNVLPLSSPTSPP